MSRFLPPVVNEELQSSDGSETDPCKLDVVVLTSMGEEVAIDAKEAPMW